jgi:hypothetical protein
MIVFSYDEMLPMSSGGKMAAGIRGVILRIYKEG